MVSPTYDRVSPPFTRVISVYGYERRNYPGSPLGDDWYMDSEIWFSQCMGILVCWLTLRAGVHLLMYAVTQGI